MQIKHVTTVFISLVLLSGYVGVHLSLSNPGSRLYQALTPQKSSARSGTQTAQFQPAQVTVGLQIGHWKNSEVPVELTSIKGNTGAQASNGYTELESNIAIAHQVAHILEKAGVKVDILPSTVPPQYAADAFIAIHADGSHDSQVQGYKIAAYAKDATGSASILAQTIDQKYGAHTGMQRDNTITKNMTHYYAFSSDRFSHAVAASTPAAIVETGFVTSTQDQEYLIHATAVPAQGIADGILAFLQHQRADALL